MTRSTSNTKVKTKTGLTATELNKYCQMLDWLLHWIPTNILILRWQSSQRHHITNIMKNCKQFLVTT